MSTSPSITKAISSRAAWSTFPKDAHAWNLAKASWQRAGCRRRSRRRKTRALNRSQPHLRVRQDLISRRSVPCCRRVGKAALPQTRLSRKPRGPVRSASFGSQSSIRRERGLNWSWSSAKTFHLQFRIVIPSEARDLQFAARCRSLASLGMTIHEKISSLRFLLRRFLVVSFLRVPVILVYRVLSPRTFQFHCNQHLRLVDLVVFPKSLEARRQHLYPQRTIRNPVNVRPPLPVRLQLQPSARLLPLPIHRMQYHRRIPHRLAVVVAHHHKSQVRHRPIIILSYRRPNHANHKHNHYRTNDQKTPRHSRPF